MIGLSRLSNQDIMGPVVVRNKENPTVIPLAGVIDFVSVSVKRDAEKPLNLPGSSVTTLALSHLYEDWKLTGPYESNPSRNLIMQYLGFRKQI